ncbi:MAG: hypothetical protein KF729_24340 [Sandaracinaceae bacterium]|nr:hypothetical protein [Sandaracinaceae bacterium]
MTRGALAASLALSAALSAALAAGCVEPDFEPATRVSRPRVLAIVADRPEVAPGEEARLSPVIGGAEGRAVELRWSMCPSADALMGTGFVGAGAFGVGGAEQFGGAVVDPGCEPGGVLTTALAVEGGEAIVPGECADPAAPWACTRGIAALVDALAASSGAPPELAALLVDEIGVPITVSVELLVDGVLAERAFKRVAVTRRAALGANPPAPRFAIGDVWMSARAGDPRDCVPERGERPVVSGLAEVHLRPDPDDGAWLETFPVVALDGALVEGRENAYYAWYSTAGDFDPAISLAPVRDTVWLSPEVPGTYALWLVVRDGHLGASACRAEVDVIDVVPPYTGIARR